MGGKIWVESEPGQIREALDAKDLKQAHSLIHNLKLLFWCAKQILYLAPQTFFFLFAGILLLFFFTGFGRGLGCAFSHNFKSFSTWVFLAG